MSTRNAADEGAPRAATAAAVHDAAADAQAAPAGPAPEAAAAAGVSTRRITFIFLAWNAAWWAAVGLFAAPVLPGGWPAVLVPFLLAVAPLPVLARILKGTLYPSAFVRVAVLRPFWYVQLALPFLGALGLVGGGVGLLFGAAGAAGRGTLAVSLAAYALLVAAGYWGSRRLVVRRVDASFEDLPPALEGLRIAQLSDLHVGPHTPRRHLEKIVAATRALEPDLIAVTGDQVDDHDHDVEHFARAFGVLRAPLGVFAVAGNHDVYAGWTGTRRGMERAGMRVLVNDAEPVRRGAAELWVAGTGDPAGAQWSGDGGAEAAPDIARTLARVPPGAFTLALAHNPALWPALAERGVHLTLSGHTHHGQLSIPALNWCLSSPFLELAMGHHQRGASLLYINPGTNYWGIPLRLGAWPEVTCVTLRRGPTGIRVS